MNASNGLLRVIQNASVNLSRNSQSGKNVGYVISGVFKRHYSPQPLKRIYACVNVNPASETSSSPDSATTYEITLDRKKLRTPARNIFQVDNPGVAYTVGAEWAAQGKTLAQSSMHLTALSNTSQDNPTKKTKYDLSTEILTLLTSETIIFRSPEDSRLWEMQRDLWDPVLYWFQDEFSIKIPIVSGTILCPTIPEDSLVSLRNFILSHSFEAVQGLAFSCHTLRSVILPIAVAKNRLRADEAVRLSRLEIDFQVSHRTGGRLNGHMTWNTMTH
ncbi:unnamed protein product [Orchesella dallaii]|uniref:ATP synthase mitochondrial F1 complex assembly factor 2 n=1 Tax=Orchesella dallaii TaxID=48710 RepID=A0ABP1QEQ0_9HEXA